MTQKPGTGSACQRRRGPAQRSTTCARRQQPSPSRPPLQRMPCRLPARLHQLKARGGRPQPLPPLLAQLHCCCLLEMTGVAAGGVAVRTHHQGCRRHGWVHPTPAACVSPSLGGSQALRAHGCQGQHGPSMRVASASFERANVCMCLRVCVCVSMSVYAYTCVCMHVCRVQTSASVLLPHAQACVCACVCICAQDPVRALRWMACVAHLPVLGRVCALVVEMGGKLTVGGCLMRQPEMSSTSRCSCAPWHSALIPPLSYP